MTIAYMKILEKDPKSFDEEFQKLFPERKIIYDLEISKIRENGRVLEIGCGTGQFALELAKKGAEVIAIDSSQEMITYAKGKNLESSLNVQFIHGDFLDPEIFKFLESKGPFDFIVSNFALSEFTSLQQQLFLKSSSFLLCSEGKFLLATETAPTKRVDRYKRAFTNFFRTQLAIFWEFSKTNPVKHFSQKISLYFEEKVLFEKKTIRLYELRLLEAIAPIKEEISKIDSLFKWYSKILVAYCILNGVLTRKSVKPGLYQHGNPQKSSPVLITGNYYWTVFSLFKELQENQISAHILVIDSRGINVWCAAGGGHFTHKQVLEALSLFDVSHYIDHKSLILPQLSATGVDRNILKKQGWKVHFGPVDISDIDIYLSSGAKTIESSRVKFSLSYRSLMAIQHAFFVLVILFLPLWFLVFLLSALSIPTAQLWLIVIPQTYVLALVVNFFFALIYPIFDFTTSFFKKGVSVALFCDSILILLLILLIKDLNFLSFIYWLTLGTLIGLFTVLDFAGHTPYTNHLDVESDLVLFIIPGLVLIILAILLPLIEKEIIHFFIH